MSEPDWKAAPEGATHYHKLRESFYSLVDGSFIHCGSNGLFDSGYRANSRESDDVDFISGLVKRPSAAWHETGDLPPVGTECDYLHSKNQWLKASILAIAVDDAGERLAILQLEDDWGWCSCIERLRPIKSDRDKAIEEMVSVLCQDFAGQSQLKIAYGFAGKLYDAGYRKPLPPSSMTPNDESLRQELTALKLSLENSEKWKNELVKVVKDFVAIIDRSFVGSSLDNAAIRAQNLLDSMEQK